MIDIAEVSLIDIMPANLLADKKVKDAAEAIDRELAKTTAFIREDLLIPRIDELPEKLIDLLARQWHVDFYEYNTPTLPQKRAAVKKSVDWHRHKGTPYAVKEIIRLMVGDAAGIKEWFEYGGDPYHFRITITGDDYTYDEPTIYKAVRSVKNTRSWCDGFELAMPHEWHAKHQLAAALNVSLDHRYWRDGMTGVLYWSNEYLRLNGEEIPKLDGSHSLSEITDEPWHYFDGTYHHDGLLPNPNFKDDQVHTLDAAYIVEIVQTSNGTGGNNTLNGTWRLNGLHNLTAGNKGMITYTASVTTISGGIATEEAI